MVRWIRGLFRLQLLGIPLLASFGVSAAEEIKRDHTLCTAQFSVKDDRFVAQLTITREGAYSAAAAKDPELLAFLNSIFAFDLPISVWAEPDPAIRAYVAREARPPRPEMAGPQDWSTATASLRKAPGSRDLLSAVFRSIVTSDYFTRSLEADTPFRLQEIDTQVFHEDLNRGILHLRLLDPVSPADVAPKAIQFAEFGKKLPKKDAEISRAGAARESLSAALQPLIGKPWIRRELQVRIADWYDSRGADAIEPAHIKRKIGKINAAIFNPKTSDSPGELLKGAWEADLRNTETGLVQTLLYDSSGRAANRFIKITEPRYINFIEISVPAATTPEELGRVLYTMVDQSSWKFARQRGWDKVFNHSVDEPPDRKRYRISVDSLFPPKTWWPLFSKDLRWRSGALALLGYSAASKGVERRRTSLLLLKTARNEAEKVAHSAAAEVTSSQPDEALPPDASEVQKPKSGDSEIEKRSSKPTVVEKEHRHMVQFSAEFKPGQGTDVRGSYSHALLEDRTALAKLELGVLEQPLGNFELKKDFLFFEQFGRRIALDLNGYSNFAPDALVATMTADERRNGVLIGTEVELLRARKGHWIVGRLEVQRERVRAKPSAGGIESEADDSSLRLSGTWFHCDPSKLGSPETLVDTSARLARQSENEYATWSLIAHQHRYIGSFMQADFTAAMRGATDDTPILNQPRLGGTDSVRGYKEDAVVATTVLEANAELWFPLRGLESKWPKFGPALRRQFAALFVDAGHFRDGSDTEGTLIAVGAGLRLSLAAGQVIKLDVAHGLRDAGNALGATRLGFSMAADFPF